MDNESKEMMIEFIKMMLVESKNMLIYKVIGKE